MLKGRMKRSISMLATSLQLLKGQHVWLRPATNIPGGGYFASPVGGLWADAPPQSEETSILIRPDEVDDDVEFLNLGEPNADEEAS